MPGQSFVNISVVRTQQIQNAGIAAQCLANKHLCFAAERFDETDIVIGKQHRVDLHFIQAPEVQPLRREIIHQRVYAALIRQHAPHLLFINARVGQSPLLCQFQQGCIGCAAPEKVGQPGGQLQVTELEKLTID